MPKPSAQDNRVAYAAGAILVGLVAAFIFGWNHFKSGAAEKPTVVFAKFGPFQIETEKFSVSTTLAIQTSNGDADWAKENRPHLDVLFKQVLAETDPKVVSEPNGLLTLQQALRDAGNAGLHTQKLEAVLLTDFLLQANDE